MSPRGVLIGAAAALGIGVTGWALIPSGSNASDQPHKDPASLAMGAQIYAETCASCHGVNLEGEPNWRERKADGRLPAPPHDETGHTWHHDSVSLFRITKYGVAAAINEPGYPSDMPIYDGVLSDEQIMAVLNYIRSTWPDDIQKAYDAREAGM